MTVRMGAVMAIQKIALHVDDNQGRAIELDADRLRVGGNKCFPLKPRCQRAVQVLPRAANEKILCK